MIDLIILRVDNRPAEDEEYTIGCVAVKAADRDKALEEIPKLREHWLGLPHTDKTLEDEQFLQFLESRGYMLVEPPTELTLV